MDLQSKIGLGAAIIFFFLTYVVKDMPSYIAWPGIIWGLLLAFSGFIPNHEKIHIQILTSITLLACLLGSLIWGIESYKNVNFAAQTQQNIAGPIQWTWDENSPLGTGMSYGGPLYILAFQIKGKNVSEDPLTSIKTYIRNDITTNIYELKFSNPESGQLIQANKVIVPPNGNFTLVSSFLNQDGGILADRFRIDFRHFTLFFEHDGQTIKVPFIPKDVDGAIDRATRANRNALTPPPDKLIVK